MGSNDLPPSNGGAFRMNEPAVVADVIDDETIIMNLESGDYFSLNSSGGAVWQLLVSGLRRDQILTALSERYGGVPTAAEVDAFVARAIEFGLVVPGDPAAELPDADAAGVRKAPAWNPPDIAVYRDMKELLALDPPLPLKRNSSG